MPQSTIPPHVSGGEADDVVRLEGVRTHKVAGMLQHIHTARLKASA